MSEFEDTKDNELDDASGEHQDTAHSEQQISLDAANGGELNQNAKKIVASLQAKIDSGMSRDEIAKNPAQKWALPYLKDNVNDTVEKVIAKRELAEKAKSAQEKLANLPQELKDEVEAYKKGLLEDGISEEKAAIHTAFMAERLNKAYEERISRNRSNGQIAVGTFSESKTIWTMEEMSKLDKSQHAKVKAKVEKGEAKIV